MRELTTAGLSEWLKTWTWPDGRHESVAVHMALGRVLAEPVMATRPVPPWQIATVSGLAVIAAATGEDVYLKLGVDAHHVEAGERLPPGTDTVLGPLDYYLSDQSIWLVDKFQPGKGVKPPEFVVGDLVVPAGVMLTGPALVACQAAGPARVQVVRRPRVAVYPLRAGRAHTDRSGHAARSLDDGMPGPGHEPETTSILLAAAAQEWGAEPQVNPLVMHEEQLEQRLLLSARSADMLVVIDGDRQQGAALTTAADRPCLWLPADPAALWVAAWRWLQALLAHWYGQRWPQGTEVVVTLAQPIPRDTRGCLLLVGQIGRRFVAWPLPGALGSYRGAVDANAIFVGESGARAGDLVAAELLEPVGSLRRRTLIAGPVGAAEVQPRSLALHRRIHLLHLTEDETAEAVALGLVHGRLAGERGEWWLDPAPGVEAAELHRQLQDALPDTGPPVPIGWAQSGD